MREAVGTIPQDQLLRLCAEKIEQHHGDEQGRFFLNIAGQCRIRLDNPAFRFAFRKDAEACNLNSDFRALQSDFTQASICHFAIVLLASRSERTTAIPDGPPISVALREQLGLRLEEKRASVEFLVVTHVEKPSAN